MSYDTHIFFTAADSWYSRFLRWVEGSSVSHMGFEYTYMGERVVLEASKIGVGVVTVENSRKGVVRRFRCTYDSEPGVKAVARHLGERYDYEGAFILGAWLLVKKAFGWCRLKLHRPVYRTEWKKCSELFYDFVQANKLDLADMKWRDPEWLTPQNVLDICVANAAYFEEIES